MQLSLSRVAKNRGRNLQALEGILHVAEKYRQRFNGYRDILDAWRGTASTLHLMQRGNESLGEAPKQLKVLFVLGHASRGGQTSLVNRDLDHFIDFGVQLVAGLRMLLDEQ